MVSPDTESYAQVGFGDQDQLMYASDIITVEEADLSCPEIVEEEEDSSGGVVSLTPIRASATMAASLAAAAASMRAEL